MEKNKGQKHSDTSSEESVNTTVIHLNGVGNGVCNGVGKDHTQSSDSDETKSGSSVHRLSWAIPKSVIAQQTINPIRQIVDKIKKKNQKELKKNH